MVNQPISHHREIDFRPRRATEKKATVNRQTAATSGILLQSTWSTFAWHSSGSRIAVIRSHTRQVAFFSRKRHPARHSKSRHRFGNRSSTHRARQDAKWVDFQNHNTAFAGFRVNFLMSASQPAGNIARENGSIPRMTTTWNPQNPLCNARISAVSRNRQFPVSLTPSTCPTPCCISLHFS